MASATSHRAYCPHLPVLSLMMAPADGAPVGKSYQHQVTRRKRPVAQPVHNQGCMRTSQHPPEQEPLKENQFMGYSESSAVSDTRIRRGQPSR
jgi:hypothetical protein